MTTVLEAMRARVAQRMARDVLAAEATIPGDLLRQWDADDALLLDLAEAAVAYCRAKDAMMSGATILERNEWAALSSTLNDAIHRYNATLDMLRQDVPS